MLRGQGFGKWFVTNEVEKRTALEVARRVLIGSRPNKRAPELVQSRVTEQQRHYA